LEQLELARVREKEVGVIDKDLNCLNDWNSLN
jgi:hypothetical protein